MAKQLHVWARAGSSLDARASHVQRVLARTLSYWTLKESVLEEIKSSSGDAGRGLDGLADEVNALLAARGWRAQLDAQARTAHALARGTAPRASADAGASAAGQIVLPAATMDPAGAAPAVPEPDEAAQSAAELQRAWRAHVLQRVCDIQQRTGLPLVRLRSDAELALDDGEFADALNDRLTALLDAGLAPAYSIAELLRFVASAAPSPLTRGFAPSCSVLGNVFVVPATGMALRAQHAELGLDQRHSGLDDELDETWAAQRTAQAERVVRQGSVAEARAFLRCGAPAAQRGALWLRALALELSYQDALRYEALLNEAECVETLADCMAHADVRATCDDEHYFVFRETLDAVLAATMHDGSLAARCAVVPIELRGRDSAGRETTLMPPSGLVPFSGLAALAAPLCFVFGAADVLFAVWRALYAQLFCRLHAISSDGESLLGLCRTFESLVAATSGPVVLHLQRLGVRLLDWAGPWIGSAFSGWLVPAQVLALWDRLLAADSLVLLAVLAAAVVRLRSSTLLLAADGADVRAIMADIRVVQVVPLMQHYLFIDLP